MKFKKSRIVASNLNILPRRKASKQDGFSTGNTEDGILRRFSETLGPEKRVKEYFENGRNIAKCQLLCCLTVGFISLAWGIGSLIYTPFQTFMDLRLYMTPGLPPFEWWIHPPDEVLMKAYLFNVTNAEAFLNGTDKKLAVKEVGPLIYREKLIHSNPVFNENGTLTYTANRTAIFLPEMNTIDPNDIVIVPNLAVLLMPAYFHDSSMIVKIGINIMLGRYNAQPLVKTTINNYFWNMTDPILEPAKKIAPRLVPRMNVGILDNIYSNFVDNVTIFVGPKYGHDKFFTIDNYDGSTSLPHYSHCDNKFVNASEGLGYPQFLAKNGTLMYWRKTLCKLAKIQYNKDITHNGLKAHHYVLSEDNFNRTEPVSKDCYRGEPQLPDGLTDVSPCYFGYPIAASFPHFLYSDDIVKQYVDGLEPNEENHASYVIVEPITGVPLEGKARSQINLVINKFWGFSERVQRFSGTVIPLAWIEYYQVGIPWYIYNLVYFVVVVVPIGQLPFSIGLLSLGMVCLYFTKLSITKKRTGLKEQFTKNKMMTFEAEVFIK